MTATTEKKVESIQLTPTAWSAFPEVDEVRRIGDADYAILAEIREVLVRHQAVDRFGVNLIHRHFDLNQDEVVFETTDVDNRIQKMEVLPVAKLAEHKNVLETQWVFNGPRAMVCVSYCDYNKGHKNIHSRK